MAELQLTTLCESLQGTARRPQGRRSELDSRALVFALVVWKMNDLASQMTAFEEKDKISDTVEKQISQILKYMF